MSGFNFLQVALSGLFFFHFKMKYKNISYFYSSKNWCYSFW